MTEGNIAMIDSGSASTLRQLSTEDCYRLLGATKSGGSA